MMGELSEEMNRFFEEGSYDNAVFPFRWIKKVAQLEAEKQWVIDLCKDTNHRTRYTLKQACEFLDFIIAKLEAKD